MANDARDISAFLIQDIVAGYIMKASYSQANVNLASINISDLNPTSLYKNVSILRTNVDSISSVLIMK